jgi:hypothetical protein
LRKKFLLRISPELWEDLNEWAEDELRSVNSQIEYILRQAVVRRKRQKEKPEEQTPEGSV